MPVFSKIRVWLVVDGMGEFEVVRYESHWGINELPICNCTLAVGRNVLDGMSPAAAHQQLTLFDILPRGRVYAQIDGEFATNVSWPSTAAMIFDGYVTGLGYRKMNGQLQLVCSIIHWLSDLAFSSTLSQQSHPSNPSDYTFQAIYATVNPGGAAAAAGVLPGMVANSVAPNLFVWDNIVNDLWGKVLKSFFVQLSNTDTLEVPGIIANAATSFGKNTVALKALARIEGTGGTPQDLKLSGYNVPLSLDSSALGDGNIAFQVAESIQQHIGNITLDSLARTTLWDTLVGGIAPQFMFGVIPQVDKALVVPITPGLRQTYRNTISHLEYDYVDFNAAIPRPIGAMAVMAGQQNQFGGEAAGGVQNPNIPSITGVGGFYASPNIKPGQGMLRFIGAPAWLANVPSSATSPLTTTGVKGKIAIGTATTPGGGGATRGGRGGVTQSAAALGSVALYNRYAQSMYIVDALRGRMALLVGKLRFDLAPGTSVLVEGKSEQHLAEDDRLGQNNVGMIAKISIGIDAEGQRAGTSYQLINLRTEEENSDNSKSVARHPLYSKVFVGAPLLDAYAF